MDGHGALPRGECLELLRTARLGRLVFTDRALPAVLPVDFVLDATGGVVLRTPPGSRLAAAVRGRVVAFHADRVDARTGAGWSVTVVGEGRPVTDPGDLAALPHRPWPGTPTDLAFRIGSRYITGQRVCFTARCTS
ncbi:pyridoxamine 5'-phosphate oxidase family protein [Actinomadura flavalba]|uniref:pyridoxamine 5'-phosphate oxidase family protein n=1 Tax=Actinomadura flavalba TaxID=1120938 RepID=UPI0003806D53|nr:pyridoxamine 5'-phosphate oxidase family protein [Actinomadura flavalba]